MAFVTLLRFYGLIDLSFKSHVGLIFSSTLARQNHKQLPALDHFYRTCIDETDPSELLIVLSDMSQNGCTVDPSTVRPNQSAAGSDYL